MPAPSPDPLPPFDARRFHARPLAGRPHLVETASFGRPIEPSASAADLIASLPDFLGAKALRGLAAAIAAAHRAGRPVAFGLGGHVLKVGLGPLLIDMLERGLAQAFVMNGAAAIHDAEVALVGSTSEDVGGGLFEGTYGDADETGKLFAAAAARAVAEKIGLGTALGRLLLEQSPPNAACSVLVAAARRGVPVTVHVAIGTDTVHMHPACRGADLGAATHGDFLRLARLVEGMDGGVYVNVGSAVVLPEVFLKAVALVHNAAAAAESAAAPGAGPARRVRLTTGNLDMLRHYRPRVNVLERPAERGFDVAGHHEILLPLLRVAVLALLASPARAGQR